ASGHAPIGHSAPPSRVHRATGALGGSSADAGGAVISSGLSWYRGPTVTSQQEFLARLVRQLEDAAIPYMVAGSLASGFHGEPRATNDLDVVIHPTLEQLHQLTAAL